MWGEKSIRNWGQPIDQSSLIIKSKKKDLAIYQTTKLGMTKRKTKAISLSPSNHGKYCFHESIRHEKHRSRREKIKQTASDTSIKCKTYILTKREREEEREEGKIWKIQKISHISFVPI